MSQEKVQEWVAEFMKATSGGGGGTPTDWKKLQDLMSKRVTVREASENPYIWVISVYVCMSKKDRGGHAHEESKGILMRA
jgi:hypothetical protein